MALTEEQKERKRMLFRARNRAQSILIQRHYEEFTELKDEILAKWGHQPIEPSRVHRVAVVSEDTPLDEPVHFARAE